MESCQAIESVQFGADIERIPAPDAATFRQKYEYTGRPVVLTDVASGWPALERWSLEYLDQVCGDRRLPVEVSRQPDFKLKITEIQEMRFGDLLDRVFRDEGMPSAYYYLRFSRIFPELERDVVFPELLSTGPRSDGINFYVGQRGAATALHHDSKTTLYAQIRGRKRWILWAPEDTANLYRWPWYRVFEAHRAQVDPRRPDLERFPDYRHARPIEVVLNPGEVLFVPPFWWHHVESLEPTLSVNVFYQVAIRDLLRYPASYFRFTSVWCMRALRILARGKK